MLSRVLCCPSEIGPAGEILGAARKAHPDEAPGLPVYGQHHLMFSLLSTGVLVTIQLI